MFPWNSLFNGNKDQQEFFKNIGQSDVQTLVDKFFTQVLPENAHEQLNKQRDAKETSSETSDLSETVFETHSHIYIRIPIPEEEWLKKMKIFHTSNQSIIQGIPNDEDKHVIPLPSLVRKKGAFAQYKDNILEIRLQKHTDMQFSEIDVSEF